MSRRIDSERGVFYVSDFDLGLRSLKENGFSYAFNVTVDGKRREIWDKAESVTKHNFVLRMETLDRIDVPKEVEEHVVDYLDKHNLGKLVSIRRASNHPDDDYLYHVAALKGDEFRCWTSWNEHLQSLNNGHYGLKELVEVAQIFHDNYNDIDKEG